MRKNKQFMKKVLCVGATMVLCASLLGGCGAKVNDFATYAQSIDSIAVPESVRIVALGEATHGNKEFQELKLDVFAQLVESTNVRAFALEGDFSGCAIANDYILYGEGSAEEAVRNLGFQIYRTDEMLELVEWMHAYNQEAADEDKVRLYGFDMQRDIFGIQRVKKFYETVDAAKAVDYGAQFDTLYGAEADVIHRDDLPEMETLLSTIIADMETNADAYVTASDENTYAYALQAANCLLQNVALHGSTNDYSTIRDKYMAENVNWILNREETLYGKALMISGHNGHVAKAVSTPYTNMGYYLSEEMGEEYYVIGTDFYNTSCSIANNEGRGDYEFCSDDLLAKAVGEMDENIYYLDFQVAEGSQELADIISNPMKMGSLGESYTPIMKVLKSTYQINFAPETLYDGMIFVYEATPIEVWDVQ